MNGKLAAVLAALVLACACSAVSAAPVLLPLAGTAQQTAPQFAAFPNVLGVFAVDSGAPAAGLPITFDWFSADTGSGYLQGGTISGTYTTDAQGHASLPSRVLAGLPGSFTVRASTPSASSPALFFLTVKLGGAVTIEKVSGDNQVAAAGTAFSQPPAVRVRDGAGSVVPYAIVFFALQPQSGAGGSFVGGTATAPDTVVVLADAGGVATSPTVAANATAGAWRIAANSGTAASISFSLSNTSGATPAVPNVQDMWWAGSAENGWGLSIVQHRDVLFTVIYGYNEAGNPVWYVMSGGTWNDARTAYLGPLYIPRGTPFYAYNPASLVIGASVGGAILTFSDAGHAVLDATINGMALHKNITRNLFGPVDAPGTDYGDLWWGGVSQNGWGVSLLQQYHTIFGVWYTYSADGVTTWYMMPSGTWTSPTTYEGRMYRTRGTTWLGRAYDPTQLQVIDVGSFKLAFSGDGATLDWSIEGRSGTQALSRNGF